MPKEYKNVWIRIAGNSRRMRENLPPPHWRYEIDDQPEQHLLRSWALEGETTPHNNAQGTNPKASGDNFLAWVQFYGDILVDDNQAATITLRPVPNKDS